MKILMRFFLLLLCFIVPNGLYTYAQTITTIAGGGASLADGVPATTAHIGLFGNITVDLSGNVYIALASKVKKINQATGIITTVAGTGTVGYNGDGILATAAQIDATFVVVDNAGNLYINDGSNWRIRKIDVSTGIISTIAGTGTPGFSGDNGPATTAQTSDGAQGIAVDDSGNVYISDGGNHRIRRINTAGIITTIAGTGAIISAGDGGPATAASISNGMFGICTDALNNVYCTDGAGSVRKINILTGVITRVAGTGDSIITPYSGDGIPATSAHIAPLGVAVDVNGNIYIADYNNSRIEMVDAFGIIHTIAGTGVSGFSGDAGPATAAKISYPENLCLDACNNVYIADFNNQRARKVTYPPTLITLTNAISTLIATVCAGTAATYTAAATTSSGAITYQWYLNGTPVAGSSASTYTYTPADADSIRCIATATSPCTSAVTSSNSIIMSVTPIATPTITVTAPAVAAVGSTVTVSAVVAGAGSGYSINWYNNSTLFSTTTAPTTTYTKAAGTDHITATIVPPTEGCYDSTGSNTSIVSANTTGTSPQPSPKEREMLRTYPNPLKDLLYVDEVSKQAEYKIRSVIGSSILQGTLQQENNTINVKELPAGVYMLEVVYPDGMRVTNKVIKQ